MKLNDIKEIVACLPAGRTKFYYFKDRYALMLLRYVVGEGKAIRDLKESRFNRLLGKPMVHKVIKTAGDGRLKADTLESIWPEDYHCYRLTLGIWGDGDRDARFYNQTSRPGWNLVLQLNFSGRHNRACYRMLKPGKPHPFHSYGHPIAGDGEHTLAWARMDMDLDTDEALIEEIQTDWIRRALWSRKYLTAYEKRSSPKPRYVPSYVKNLGCDAKALSQYIDGTLKPHMRIWNEAMLASAIWFLKEEIGIGKIYYHTYKFGCQVKRITYSKPPRSLYTQLPDRFCFEKINQAPAFLFRNNNRKILDLIKNHNPQFYVLDIPTG
ncbi:MAG: hypothetical protein P8X96_06765 [Desulfobacteraceae bacterium]